MMLSSEFILARFVFQSFPAVSRELKIWERAAGGCPDIRLREQTLSSIKLKKFHCQGGSVFAAWVNTSCRGNLIRAIVALQTISDYLDNLCDRAGVQDEESFRQLHQSFLDALSPGVECIDYYQHYPCREDGGYLASLVSACRNAVSGLPFYSGVKEAVLELAGLYCTLQVYKHLEPNVREKRLIDWLEPYLVQLDRRLFWWELAAATGSTLGIFALLALAAKTCPTAGRADEICRAYFPWITGLHILLDYFIDQQEDIAGGDLNFAGYYADLSQTVQRLEFMLEKSLSEAGSLAEPFFHLLVVRGLLAMYLSDPKVKAQDFLDISETLLRAAGNRCIYLHRFCSSFRRAGLI
ncbi:MAG: tetraprenyl-beta-curcumene synthase family protein [Eubacteriales bacterium]|jgi:tetraprenyl-beta-curcumene synthase